MRQEIALRDAEILYGAQAIADALGIKRRHVFHLIETGRLPIFRIEGGRTICIRRSTLLTWVAEQEARSMRSGRPAVTG